MRLGAIDIGTNTLRLVVGELDSGGTPRFILQKIAFTRLGEGLEKRGEIAPEVLERTLRALEDLQKTAREHGARMPEGYATAWARKASNTDAMLSAAAKINLPVWILTAEEEAALGLEAVKLMNPALENFRMIDIGGGSTQIARVSANKTVQTQSFPVGAVNTSEKHPVFGEKEISELKFHFQSRGLEPESAQIPVVALGGTAACLAALKIEIPPEHPGFFGKAQGLFLETPWFREELKILSGMPVEMRRKLPGMEAARADILPGGTALLYAFLEQENAGGAVVCLYSFIHGLLAGRLAKLSQ